MECVCQLIDIVWHSQRELDLFSRKHACHHNVTYVTVTRGVSSAGLDGGGGAQYRLVFI